ncbi:MAG: sigma-70 family RNA polymerase sigma factor [Blastocatellia bacterium]|nr:sigma-70 family RNA polymerase sigma factor [Blastocatellia bacterium]
MFPLISNRVAQTEKLQPIRFFFAEIQNLFQDDGSEPGRESDNRSAGAVHLSLSQAMEQAEEQAAEIIALDEALDRLAALDARQSRVVELRYFGGLSVEETAAVLQVSPSTVHSDWRQARAWLYLQLAPS